MISLNGITCFECVGSMPKMGAWIFDLHYQLLGEQNTPAVNGPAVIVIDNFTFTSSVLSVDTTSIFGIADVRCIAGNAGGLASVPGSKNFANGPTLQVVASSLLSAAGESLSTSLSSAVALQQRFKTYTTSMETTLAQELTRMASAAGCAWRVDPPTGQIVFFIDTFSQQAAIPSNSVVQSLTHDGSLTYDVPLLDMLPAPGTMMANGNNCNEVRFYSQGTHFYVQLLPTQGSAFVPEIQDLDPLATYSASVTMQNSDGTLNLNPDDALWKGVGMSNVPIGTAGPGLGLQVQAGARCLFNFIQGDTSMPQVTGFLSAQQMAQPMTVWTVGDQNAAQFVALSQKVDQNLKAIQTTINSLTAPAGGGPVTGTPFSPQPTAGQALKSS